ncbi:hypothetical protein E2C01_028757 [Portunus trituberculatus]|uniref:Uncharacterized protein n=1 Tax=Portunus trituberculatus TaxID=210409 RepID=A0A5B7ESN4_PORTR|nr:hypothetical protein [Portunus trituberculatus]
MDLHINATSQLSTTHIEAGFHQNYNTQAPSCPRQARGGFRFAIYRSGAEWVLAWVQVRDPRSRHHLGKPSSGSANHAVQDSLHNLDHGRNVIMLSFVALSRFTLFTLVLLSSVPSADRQATRFKAVSAILAVAGTQSRLVIRDAILNGPP